MVIDRSKSYRMGEVLEYKLLEKYFPLLVLSRTKQLLKLVGDNTNEDSNF